ncbi:16S rRNA (cytosine(967)-C(5))-methyltransferase RsmB [Desulfococcaceae bacterium HSG9]|nr:16S rRNA (cytosine(967)-C(5))-methyltransferase RsmB [Desulfococcaceae bacterium HSG9]
MPIDARQTALSVLNQLEQGRHTLDRLWEERLGVESDAPKMAKRDMALVYVLVYGVLRWRNRLDQIIAHFSNTPLRKIRPRVLNVLRLALFQIIYLDRIPVSAAVNCAVNQVKRPKSVWIGRFVNGVLRAASTGYTQTPFPDYKKNPVDALAARKSFPRWMVKRWLKRFGLNQTVALCDAINTIPPITVRFNSLLTTRQKLMQALQDEAQEIQITHYSSYGISLEHPRRSVPEMKAFKSGWFQVQDEAAQLSALLLNPQPGETVLDACAGLGGKTGHIAALMQNRGVIVATDYNKAKLRKLEDEMARLQISIVTSHFHNLAKPWKTAATHRAKMQFDRILLDAPCSGLGVLRRNPDAKWRAKPDWKHYQNRQLRFLEHVAQALKPGGVLVYTVCSMEPEENEAVIEKFLKRKPEFYCEKKPDGPTIELPDSVRKLVDQNGYLRTFPHHHNMDGFFAVRLMKGVSQDQP